MIFPGYLRYNLLAFFLNGDLYFMATVYLHLAKGNSVWRHKVNKATARLLRSRPTLRPTAYGCLKSRDWSSSSWNADRRFQGPCFLYIGRVKFTSLSHKNTPQWHTSLEVPPRLCTFLPFILGNLLLAIFLQKWNGSTKQWCPHYWICPCPPII